MLQVSEIYIYPIKSLPGISVTKAMVTEKGFQYDRRWMLIDMENRFISQREFNGLTQFGVSFTDEGFLVKHNTEPGTIIIPFQLASNAGKVKVTIWDDTCDALYVSEKADHWFSTILGMPCRLVYMPDDSKRIVDERYTPAGTVTSFSDAYPYLIIGQESLNNINSRLTQEIAIDRFRPNIVFTGGDPYHEDVINVCTIGSINFYGVKLCARCLVITIDQQTGSKGKEPTKTLAKYRTKNNKIYLGQNLIHSGDGVVSIGDEIIVKSEHTEERFFIIQAPKTA